MRSRNSLVALMALLALFSPIGVGLLYQATWAHSSNLMPVRRERRPRENNRIPSLWIVNHARLHSMSWSDGTINARGGVRDGGP